ncbi:MAG: hypothetical protein N3E52_00305 [Candidatus Bathyarchaeota archaeon]|nr:hypothetical protein [Candidatus Bathyarchaeota archaeon]
MCGIFGFALKTSIHPAIIFRILKKLEVNRYPEEEKPVGGYGAGVAVLRNDGSVLLEKIGKIDASPAARLEEIMLPKLSEVSILIGHVRYPSAKFMQTVEFKETTQPYVENFGSSLTIVSAHNGTVANYQQLQARLHGHSFESSKVELIDSEVIPHYFSELLNETGNADNALLQLLFTLQGSNTISMLHIDDEGMYLHLLHKGKTRGLTVWTNNKDEIVFCSRPEPVIEEFGRFLVRDKFKEKVSIKWREEAVFKMSFPISLQ